MLRYVLSLNKTNVKTIVAYATHIYQYFELNAGCNEHETI
jgi:hypothetical protein